MLEAGGSELVILLPGDAHTRQVRKKVKIALHLPPLLMERKAKKEET